MSSNTYILSTCPTAHIYCPKMRFGLYSRKILHMASVQTGGTWRLYRWVVHGVCTDGWSVQMGGTWRLYRWVVHGVCLYRRVENGMYRRGYDRFVNWENQWRHFDPSGTHSCSSTGYMPGCVIDDCPAAREEKVLEHSTSSCALHAPITPNISRLEGGVGG